MTVFYAFLIAFFVVGILSGIITPIYIATQPNISNMAEKVLRPLCIGLIILTVMLLISCLICGLLVAKW